MLQYGVGDASGKDCAQVVDWEVWGSFLAVLFEKNLVMVYDLKHGPSRAGHEKNQGKNFKDGSK